jgi:hypothetical protein
MLTSQHVSELIASTELPKFLKLRLTVSNLEARGFESTRRLVEALAFRKIQQSNQGPINTRAIAENESNLRNAIAELESCFANLHQIEPDCLQVSGFGYDLWSICFARGNLRTVAAAPMIKMGGSDDIAKDWLEKSIEDFRAAITAAHDAPAEQCASLIMRAALDGRTAAKALKNQILLAEFEKTLDAFRSDPTHRAELEDRQALQQHDPLELPSQTGTGHGILRLGGEKAIAEFTDQIMRSSGYPEDRRKHVEDDIRKLEQTEIAQWEFCRHLQPLQNLIHLKSPETVYARPTMYTCSCTLLGYQTRFETDDIHTAINGMRRAFCDECTRRSPLQEGGSKGT